jgi:cytochrome c biogenesis protein CcdA
MLRLVGVALGVGLADSINPSTIGPALYLAAARNGAMRVMLFTIGVFAVNFAGGVALTVGPGRLLRGLVPHPQGTARHVLELVAGVVLLVVAGALWVGRRKLARRAIHKSGGGGRGSALIAGTLIAAVELPTALPYFAVIGTIVASGVSVLQAIVLIALYCFAFVAPLLAIAAALVVAGDRATPWLEKAAGALQRRWPVVLASILLLVGGALAVLGGSGLA